MAAHRHSPMNREVGGNPLLGHSGRGVAGHPSGRVCAAPACATVLSMYNGSEFCSLHEPWIRRTGAIRP